MYFFCIFAICITEYITISAISIVNVTLKTDDSKYDLAILTFALSWERSTLVVETRMNTPHVKVVYECI